jgi:hypothetical protein
VATRIPIKLSNGSYFDGAFAEAGALGFVEGPPVATDGNLAVFDGASGQLIRDGGPVPSPSPGAVQWTTAHAGPFTHTNILALGNGPTPLTILPNPGLPFLLRGVHLLANFVAGYNLGTNAGILYTPFSLSGIGPFSLGDNFTGNPLTSFFGTLYGTPGPRVMLMNISFVPGPVPSPFYTNDVAAGDLMLASQAWSPMTGGDPANTLDVYVEYGIIL